MDTTLIIIILIVELVIAYFAATEFQKIAQEKGYTDKKYFWWCFWLLGIGALMVIALPDRKNRTNSEPAPVPTFDDLPNL